MEHEKGMRNSAFSAETIKELLLEKEKALSKINTELDYMQKQIDGLNFDIESYAGLDKELFDWNERFDNGDNELKKAMLASVIDKDKGFMSKYGYEVNKSF